MTGLDSATSVQQALCRLLAEQGRGLVQSPARLQALLNAQCPRAPREVNLLVRVAQIGLVAELQCFRTLEQRMRHGYARLDLEFGMAEHHAGWALACWLRALNELSPMTEGAIEPLDHLAAAAESGWRSQYLDHQDGTLSDLTSGLMWKRQAEAQDFTYKEAVQQCQPGKLEFAGFSDWRLPRIDELQTLVLANQRPAICQRAFPEQKYWFWSASPHGGNPYHAWRISFYDGSIYSYLRHYRYGVRLVRSRA